MATTIDIACPECKKLMKVPAEVQGKKIRCKSCGHVFPVPASRPGALAGKAGPAAAPAVKKPTPAAAGKTAPTRKEPPAKPAPTPAKPSGKGDEDDGGAYGFLDDNAPLAPPPPKPDPAPKAAPARKNDDGEDANPYGVTDIDLAPRCPHCAQEMEGEDAVICLNCGYNTQTREKGTVKLTIAHTPFEHFVWLLPGIVCGLVVIGFALFIAFLWLWMDKAAQKDPEAWWTFFNAFPTQVWGSVISAGIIWLAGRFAFKRLVLHPKPPEKLKG